jgi:hypothetical protein
VNEPVELELVALPRYLVTWSREATRARHRQLLLFALQVELVARGCGAWMISGRALLDAANAQQRTLALLQDAGAPLAALAALLDALRLCEWAGEVDLDDQGVPFRHARADVGLPP